MSILVTGSAGHLGEALVRSLRAQGRSAIGSIGIGFAIPSNMASNVMQQLEHGGKVRRGKLGAGIQAVTPELAKSLGIVGTQGVLVNSVEAGGAAEAAGIRAGDVITAVNGHGVQDANSLKNAIANFAPATDVSLTVLTRGKEREVHVRLAELSQSTNSPGPGAGAAGARLGVTVESLAPDVAPRLGMAPGTRGVTVVSVDPQGVAARGGVQPGDVIVEVNHQSVGSAAELSAALRKSGSPVLLLINRQGLAIFLGIDLLP